MKMEALEEAPLQIPEVKVAVWFVEGKGVAVQTLAMPQVLAVEGIVEFLVDAIRTSLQDSVNQYRAAAAAIETAPMPEVVH